MLNSTRMSENGIAQLAASCEKPLPPSILPVVFLQGTDYEIGYQYGEQAAPYINACKDSWYAYGYEEFGTKDKILHELKAYERFIKQDAAELIDMMMGIADGATAAGHPVSYIDVLLLNTAKALKPIPPEEGPNPTIPKDHELGGCAHFHAWGKTTKDGKLICADNRDEPPATHQVCLIVYPETGNIYLTTTNAGQVACHPIMNNKGVFIGGSTGPGTRPIDKQYGIPRPCALAHMGRFSNNAIEAKDWAANHQCVWKYTIIFSMADVHGNAFVVEHSPAIKRIRKPGDFGEADFIFATNNYLLEEMRVTGDLLSFHSEYRNEHIFDHLRNYQGKVDVDFIKMMYRSGQSYPPETYGAEEGFRTLSKENTARVVIAVPEDGNGGVAHICTGNPSRGAFGNTPISPTGSFYEVTLAANPSNVTVSAEEAADWALQKVWPKLMKLNYGHVKYAPLMEIVVQAKEEYYKGINVKNTAIIAAYTGAEREALYLYSQAATHFTRCQALARQVYNVLAPPAVCPDDLGLVRSWPFIRWERPPHSTEWKQIEPPTK